MIDYWICIVFFLWVKYSRVLFATKSSPFFNSVRIRVDLSLPSLGARPCCCWVVPAIIAPVLYCYPFVVKALTNK